MASPLLRGLLGPRLLTRGFRAAVPGAGSRLMLRGLKTRRLLIRGFGGTTETVSVVPTLLLSVVVRYPGRADHAYTTVINL